MKPWGRRPNPRQWGSVMVVTFMPCGGPCCGARDEEPGFCEGDWELNVNQHNEQVCPTTTTEA